MAASQRNAFFSAVKRSNWSAAWKSYAACAKVGSVDKYMLSALVSLTARKGKTDALVTLWHTVRGSRVAPATSKVPLDAHLSSDFISGFGRRGKLAESKLVLDAARDEGLVNTRVYNAFLRACSRAKSGSTGNDPLTEAELVLTEMQASDHTPPDAYTCSLAASILGPAGKLHEAEALFERTGASDTVANNVLINEAMKAGDGHRALAILARMESEGPPPDELSYATALQVRAERWTPPPRASWTHPHEPARRCPDGHSLCGIVAVVAGPRANPVGGVVSVR